MPLMLAVFCLLWCNIHVLADSHTGGVHYREEVVYQWNLIEYEWPNSSWRDEQISNGNYIPKNSAINGIKLYKDNVYVTTPRLKKGVPSTLNVIVKNEDRNATESHMLRPFPSWDMQKLGDCNALQLVQSMEIDINTGYMWIVDTGKKSYSLYSPVRKHLVPLQGIFCPSVGAEFRPPIPIENSHIFPNTMSVFPIKKIKRIVLF